MFDRKLKEHLAYAAKKFPVVTLTGPRQSGKTTLVKHLFPNKSYVTLEDVDQRFFAKEDPRSFLKNFPHGAIIDEVQHVPDLFSYIQTRVDNNQVMGEFILTGSQNSLLSQNISQTLAGRTAVLQLLPCTTEELNWRGEDPYHLFFKGFYPAVHDRDIDPAVYYKSYVNTYVEKDVRNIINVKDLSKFHLFLQLCAGRIGQLFNASAIGSECGINHVRLTKQPKLYFYDTGLAAYLLGIESSEILSRHFVRGPIFENYVASELIKFRFNKGMESNIYFWRDHHGREVDFVIDKGTRLDAIEVKSAATITKSFFEGLNYWNSLSPDSHQYLIYGGEMHQDRSQIKVLPWKSAQQVFD